MKYFYSVVGLLLLTTILPLHAHAGSSGKISGSVTDAKTKEGIPGVNVRVEGTTLGATTNVEGNYVILNVPPGRVGVLASFIGYKKFQVKDIRVSVDFTTTLNISLEQGDIELDAVVVQGERSPLIRKDLTNPVASVSAEVIQELPVTSIDQIIGLQAGTTVDNDGSIHIRGGYGNEIAFTLNGININNPYANTRSVGLATNAVQEVSISSGTFNAEYGSALSGVVNYVTKDGGPRWTMSMKYYTGDNVSSFKNRFYHTETFRYLGSLELDPIRIANVNRTEATFGGPIIDEVLSFYGSGVYNWNGGYLYGIQLYRPQDGYLSREGFPSGDPRRGSSSDPYFFGPLRNPSTDSVGLPSGDGNIVPLNWSRSYNLQGNLSLRVGSDMKLKYEIVYDNDLRPRNEGNSRILDSRYKPDGRNLNSEKGVFHSIEWTHAPTANFFYTLKGSYITNDFTSRAYEDAADPRYLPSFYLQRFPGTSFLTGGVDLYRQIRQTKTIAFKIDAVAQLWDIHEFKLGFELRSHDLKNTEYTLSFVDTLDRAASVSLTNAIRGSKYVPIVAVIKGGEAGFISFRRKPVQLAAYLQDKIELFQSIILNLGLRYEYFDPAASYNPKLSEEFAVPDSENFYGKNSIPATKKHMLSPRISVSYPITDQGTIRFSYGHFYQIGSLSSVYENLNYGATQNSVPTFGNANVNPQRSTQYELGLQQALNDNLKIEITGYYKDVSDYIYSQRILAGRGDLSYNVLTNLNYANTRGVSVSLLKRRSREDLLSATIDYTFQIADGNRTQPTEDVFYSEQRGQLSESFLVPFSFDRSHTITSTVTLSEPDNWNISAISYVRTGTPYTPSFPSNIVPISFTQNSDRQTVQWNVDLKAEKFFDLGGVVFSLFVQVDNLFDTQNETSVYANSGRALFNIEQTVNTARFVDIRNRINRKDPGLIPIGAIDDYFANPANLNQPRLVRIGTSINF